MRVNTIVNLDTGETLTDPFEYVTMCIIILVIIVFIGSSIISSSCFVELFCTYLQNVTDSYCTNYA